MYTGVGGMHGVCMGCSMQGNLVYTGVGGMHGTLTVRVGNNLRNVMEIVDATGFSESVVFIKLKLHQGLRISSAKQGFFHSNPLFVVLLDIEEIVMKKREWYTLIIVTGSGHITYSKRRLQNKIKDKT